MRQQQQQLEIRWQQQQISAVQSLAIVRSNKQANILN